MRVKFCLADSVCPLNLLFGNSNPCPLLPQKLVQFLAVLMPEIERIITRLRRPLAADTDVQADNVSFCALTQRSMDE